MIYFGTAKTAGDKYKTAYEEESKMSGVTINGKQYGSIEEYMEEINQTIVEPENIDDWIYVLEDDGTITINGYKGSDKEVVIPNYINGVPVKKLAHVHHSYFGSTSRGTLWDQSICQGGKIGYWYVQNDITSVTISKGIEIIGQNVFFASQALETIEIPSSVKSIGDDSFNSCDSLTDIVIPNSVITMGIAFSNIPSIVVHVSWKEGEKPEGWDDGWAGGNVVIDYAK